MTEEPLHLVIGTVLTNAERAGAVDHDAIAALPASVATAVRDAAVRVAAFTAAGNGIEARRERHRSMDNLVRYCPPDVDLDEVVPVDARLAVPASGREPDAALVDAMTGAARSQPRDPWAHLARDDEPGHPW